MDHLTDYQAATICGGFRINVSPTINVTTAITTGILTNGGASIAVGLFGAAADSKLGQMNGLDIFKMLTA